MSSKHSKSSTISSWNSTHKFKDWFICHREAFNTTKIKLQFIEKL
jgi:hypothetical protein